MQKDEVKNRCFESDRYIGCATQKFILIETTYPNLKSAKKLAKLLLEKKLSPCIRLIKALSIYTWDGKINDKNEILVSIKTQKKLYRKIEKIILNNHQYDLPEIVSTEINQGFEPYLNWIEEVTK
jgi:periplasmic divalent cation tolerance protein